MQLADEAKAASSDSQGNRKGALEIMIARPALVVGPSSSWGIKAMGAVGVPTIRVETLVKALIGFAVFGDKQGKQLWENADLKAGMR